MAYYSRNIKDRVAIGDNIFSIEELPDGRYVLTPSPDDVIEEGTDINKALLQLIEDRVVWLMNSIFTEIKDNPFMLTFESLDGITAEGVWNKSAARIEC